MMQPIPDAALDDRLAFVGTAGSGKTYNAGSRVERLLSRKARVVVVDPLGVWWGLRLTADGKTASGFDVVIFGGPHGDLPLNEHAGALIGETVAGMAESCIVDLSELGTKGAERRFMLAFLTALYKNTRGEPLHIVVDEADMWAPQRILDKEDNAAKLLGMMETIVRRGRIKGFIPWLISQRPAVLSKDVLSQADGLVAFKLTSSQDRDAIGDWVEGQADKQAWKEMWAALPTMERGQGLVWIPGRSIMDIVQFPKKLTFDSSRTPTRGEKMKCAAALKPIDLGAVKSRLASVEADAKANDPKTLRAQLAAKDREIAVLKKSSSPVIDQAAIDDAIRRGFDAGRDAMAKEAESTAVDMVRKFIGETKAIFSDALTRLDALITGIGAESLSVESPQYKPGTVRGVSVPNIRVVMPKPPLSPTGTGAAQDRVTGPLKKIIDAIRWWNVMGVAEPMQSQVSFVAGYSHKSGTWATYLSRLRNGGMIAGSGRLRLTNEGAATASDPDERPSGEAFRQAVINKIDRPLARILTPILAAYPSAIAQSDVGAAAGYRTTSGTWATYLSRLRSLDLIEGSRELRAKDWLGGA